MIGEDLNKPDLSCPGDHSMGPVGPPGHGTVLVSSLGPPPQSVTLFHPTIPINMRTIG